MDIRINNNNNNDDNNNLVFDIVPFFPPLMYDNIK